MCLHVCAHACVHGRMCACLHVHVGMFAFVFAYMRGYVHVWMYERAHECMNAQVHVRTYVTFVTCRSTTDGHTYQIQEVKKEIAELSYMMRMGQVSLSCGSLEWLLPHACMYACACMHE